MQRTHRYRGSLVTLALLTATGLAACSSPATPAGDGSAEAGASVEPSAADGPRLAVSYAGGVLVLDGTTLETIADFPSEDFTRLNAAGDGTHVLVTTSAGFQVLDTGAASGTTPELTDLVFPADAAGHVVAHAGKTVLYADGTSDTTIYDTAALSSTALPEIETIPGTSAHHGVSVVLADGTFLTTVGDADGRTGIVATDADGTEVATSADCPGIHGEGTAEGEAVVFGCENGALLYQDGEITKLTAPDQPYGRMGNAYVSETSPLVVGDYKTDPDAEGYLLSQVALVDTAAATLDVVALPAGVEYTFRDVARGPGDLAYILATDGSIHELDPSTGEISAAHPVISPWEGPVRWQDPHPAIIAEGDVAYVTEPDVNAVHTVDLTTGEVLASTTLDVAPNEIALATR